MVRGTVSGLVTTYVISGQDLGLVSFRMDLSWFIHDTLLHLTSKGFLFRVTFIFYFILYPFSIKEVIYYNPFNLQLYIFILYPVNGV